MWLKSYSTVRFKVWVSQFFFLKLDLKPILTPIHHSYWITKQILVAFCSNLNFVFAPVSGHVASETPIYKDDPQGDNLTSPNQGFSKNLI